MVKDVPESLHTFFVPQMEQLGLREQPSKHGSLSTLEGELGTGVLWAHGITEHCLLSFHDLRLNEPVELMEFPDESVCIALMAGCSARLCPVELRHLYDRNTLSFRQREGRTRFTLNPGEHHRSYSLCMTPEFFDELDGLGDDRKNLLVGHLCNSGANTHPREVGLALERMDPSWAMREGGGLFCEGKVREILAYLLEAAAQEGEDGPRDRSSEDRRLAREARAMMDERFAEDLTLQSIADGLFVGRTRLCAVFRRQTGASVAEYLRGRRMAEAQRLLETTDAKAAEVARAVGYKHPSTFTDAFRRSFGMTPSQWREQAREQAGAAGNL